MYQTYSSLYPGYERHKPEELLNHILSAAFRKLIIKCCTNEEIVAAYDHGLSKIMDTFEKVDDDLVADRVVENTSSMLLRERLNQIVYFVSREVSEFIIGHETFVTKLLATVLQITTSITHHLPDTLTCSIKYTSTRTSKTVGVLPKYMSLSELSDIDESYLDAVLTPIIVPEMCADSSSKQIKDATPTMWPKLVLRDGVIMAMTGCDNTTQIEKDIDNVDVSQDNTAITTQQYDEADENPVCA